MTTDMSGKMTAARLREIYGNPTPSVEAKVIDYLDKNCRDFIANSPFFILATSDGSKLDASPKGDPKGFVKVEDDRHLIIPDRAGNNRIDGLLNMVKHPNVGMVFFIPTVNETLRVNGVASIIEDPEICELYALKGRVPKTVTRILVEEVFIHCGVAPHKGGIWKPKTWPTKRPVASLDEIFRAHAGMDHEG